MIGTDAGLLLAFLVIASYYNTQYIYLYYGMNVCTVVVLYLQVRVTTIVDT